MPPIFTEVGVGYTYDSVYAPSFPNSYVFSRVLLPATVSIAANQKMRLIYELDIAITPYANSPGVPFTASIVGWGTGSLVPGYQNVGGYYISVIDVGGGGTTGTAYLDPSGLPNVFVSNSSTANPNAGTVVDRSGTSNAQAATSADAYVPLSFTAYKSATFATNLLAENDLRTIGLGTPGSNAFCCVFTQNQTTTNVQTLTLSFVYTWGRVLS